MTTFNPTITFNHFTSLIRANFLTEAKDRVTGIFTRVSAALSQPPANPLRAAHEALPPRSSLSDPFECFVGGLWGLFLAGDMIFFPLTLGELYSVSVEEGAASDQLGKIATAAKRAFLDFFYLASSTSYMGYWLHHVQVIDLGRLATLAYHLGYGCSLITNTVEAGASIYTIYTENEAIRAATAAGQQEKHRQKLGCALIKLMGHVSMVAWAALGVAAFATGAAVSAYITTPLLLLGTALSIGAYLFKLRIDNGPNPIQFSAQSLATQPATSALGC